MDNVIATIEAAIWSFWGLLVYGALIFIVSSVSVWQARRRLNRVEAIPISSSSRERWLAEFAQWSAVDTSTPEVERVRLLQQRADVASYEALGVGLSGLLSGSMLIGFAIATRAVIAAPSSAEFLLYFSALNVVLATMYESGRFLGYRAGALRLSRGRASLPNSEVRALNDYVARWVWLVPLAASVSILLMSVYVMATTGNTDFTVRLVAAPIVAGSLLLVAASLALFRALWRLDLPDAFGIGDQAHTQRANIGAIASAIGSDLVSFWWCSLLTLTGVILGPWSNALDSGGFGQALFFSLALGTFALFLCLCFAKDKISKGKTGRIRPQASRALAATSS